MTGSEPITWAELAEAIGRLNAEAHDDLLDINARLLEARGRDAEAVYLDAFRMAVSTLQEHAYALDELAGRLAETPEPARPLGLLLADLEAEGHVDWEVGRFGGSGRHFCRSRRDVASPTDSDREAWAAWRRAAESDDVSADDLAGAVQKRLEQVRELHALRWVVGLFDVGACGQALAEERQAPSLASRGQALVDQQDATAGEEPAGDGS